MMGDECLGRSGGRIYACQLVKFFRDVVAGSRNGFNGLLNGMEWMERMEARMEKRGWREADGDEVETRAFSRLLACCFACFDRVQPNSPGRRAAWHSTSQPFPMYISIFNYIRCENKIHISDQQEFEAYMCVCKLPHDPHLLMVVVGL